MATTDTDVLAPPDTSQDYMAYGGDQLSPLEAANAAETPLGEKQRHITGIRGEIEAAKGKRDTAYDSIRSALDQATHRLQGMQIGPTDAEQRHMLAAALSKPGPSFTNNLSGYYAQQAAIEREKRLGDLPTREKLALQYAMLGPQYQLQQANQQIPQLINQQRVEQTGANPYIQRDTRLMTTGITRGMAYIDPQDPSKGVKLLPGWEQNAEAIAAANAYGRAQGQVQTIHNADGSVTIVPRANFLPKPQGVAGPKMSPSMVAAPSPATAQLRNAATGAAAANAAAAAQPAQPKPVAGQYTAANFPVYQGSVGATHAELPASLASPEMPQVYAQQANNAFQPQNFDPLYKATASGNAGVDPKEVKMLQDEQLQLNKQAVAARQQNYDYVHMLDMLDKGVRSGPWQSELTALRASLQGFIDPDDKSDTQKKIKQLLLDSEKVNTEQAFDKFAMDAGTIGLTAKFGNRVLQSEFQANLKTQPNRDLTGAAMRYLMTAGLDKNLETINKATLHYLYMRHGGSPGGFEMFYGQNFDPYGSNPVADHIHQRLDKYAEMQSAAERFKAMTPEQRAAYEAKLRSQMKPVGPPIPQQ